MNCRHLFSSMPSPQDVRDKTSNWEEGLNDLYNTKSLHCARSSNPFIPSLNKIEPSAIENAKLSWFKDAVKKAKSVGELKKIVEQGLNVGIRTNACHEGQQSFADVVILKMLSIPCTKDDKRDIIRKLLLKGAFFSYDLLQDKQISEVYNKLYREVQPQIDKMLKKLEEIGKDAVQEGSVEDVGIDNQTFFIKFSEGSTVEPAKLLEATRNLGLNKGWGGHIIKIGNNEIEVKMEEGGERNYTGLSDGGDLTMTLHSDLGEEKSDYATIQKIMIEYK